VLVAVEEKFGKLDTLFARSRMDTPAPTDFHPEIDISDFLIGGEIDLYQSYIVQLRWIVELGKIDLTHFTNTIRAFGYDKKHLKSKLVIDAEPQEWSHLEWTSSDWKHFYPDVNGEVLSPNMPQPSGKTVPINMFCDAAHATYLVTRRSKTGFIFFLNGTPINWFSK
jgi:hypothetical protein